MFFWHDKRTDKQRNRVKRKRVRVHARCFLPGCPNHSRRGWCHGFCQQHALLRECRKPAKTALRVQKTRVERVTKAKWALEGKIIKDRIKSSCIKDRIKFDEETELEGREDYEADYEKVLQGLEYPGYYSNRLRATAAVECPSIHAIMMDNPMSKHEFSFSGSHLLCELSDVPVAPPANPQSFHLPPKFWQQMHLRRLRKKTNVTLPKIDIWGLGVCARARVASLTRTCQSVNGCGHIFCDECY